MPIRDGAPLGAPCWIDLTTSDVDRAQDFYGTVFGWTFESAGPEYGGYVTASKDGRPVAGLMGNDPQFRSPDGWTTYLHTADITATLSAATAAGAATCVEPMEIKDKGHMAMLADPTGAFFGLWQPIGHHGFNVSTKPVPRSTTSSPPATTARRSTSTARCSAGGPKKFPTPTNSVTPRRGSATNSCSA